MYQITNKKSGNCGCKNCGKMSTLKFGYQPYSVYHKDDNENRGHYEPVCSIECGKQLIEKLK